MRRSLMYNFRGVYGKELTHSIAYLAGKIAAQHYKAVRKKDAPKIIVGNDHRFSSNSLKHYLMQGMISQGVIIRDIGCLPTSVLSYAVKKAADGGCMVTASHNPPEYNGLKFFEASGAVMKPAVEDAILGQVMKEHGEHYDVTNIGMITKNYGITPPLAVITEYVDQVAARTRVPRPLNIGLDCRMGTAFLIMPQLIKELGCNYFPIHDQLNPYFIKQNGEYLNPEPKESNIREISTLVKCASLDMGLIFDGDADRAVVVDDKGNYMHDDIVLLLLAIEYGADKRKVITVDTSLAVENHLRSQGFQLHITPVGDPFVSQALEEGKGSFGGVPNGHYIFPDFTPYSDGIFTAAVMVQIASKLVSEGKHLAEHVAELPKTHLKKVKVPFGRSRDEFLQVVAPQLKALFSRYCRQVDYLQTDDTVVVGKDEQSKMLVRYNRWDNNFNVHAESLESDESAEEYLTQIVGLLENC
ncbi:MAG: hypothetical protein FJ279_29545 [Planctomycetes bacterium]|nr:hypothetical protein [Planctomycetota bacterium]